MAFNNYLEAAKAWIAGLIPQKQEMLQVKFHADVGGAFINYLGHVPSDLWMIEEVQGGLLHVMKGAKLGLGWKKGGYLFEEEVRLLDMALDRFNGAMSSAKRKLTKRPKKH